MAKQNAPYVKEETAGKKFWCSCGESEKQPYCDGSHARKGTGKRPVPVDVPAPRTVAWCGCKRTGTPPFCDGTHTRPVKA